MKSVFTYTLSGLTLASLSRSTGTLNFLNRYFDVVVNSENQCPPQ